jgi:hypothetical protein
MVGTGVGSFVCIAKRALKPSVISRGMTACGSPTKDHDETCAPCYDSGMPAARRFPPPWTAEETEACFIVKDDTGRVLAYVYYEEEPGRRAAANLLTKDEARRVAVNIAKLPKFRQGGAAS